MSVVVRFAPSPTGFLHIGGARTALFNWLFARHTGGTFLLRIEDTDRKRSTTEAIDAIFESLKWLGLDWDDEPVFQFARAPRHAEVANNLVKAGRAYYCYCSPEELEEMRAAALASGKPPRYNGYWRDKPESAAPDGVVPVVRFKAPQEGKTVIDDITQGTVELNNEQLDDMILLRADGTPTYMLSVVVDDHDMGITHIIRGDDHLTNAFRQYHLYKACGWDVPRFAHIPLIYGPDGAKLSKRHGAVGAEQYRKMGFLPEALKNYLVRLGWAHGDDEIMSMSDAVEWFDVANVVRSPARFDTAKLMSLNAHYIRESSNERLLQEIREMLLERYTKPQDEAFLEGLKRIARGMDGLKVRAKTLCELAESAMFYISAPTFDEEDSLQAAGKKEEFSASLAMFLECIEPLSESFDGALEESIRDFCKKRNVSAVTERIGGREHRSTGAELRLRTAQAEQRRAPGKVSDFVGAPRDEPANFRGLGISIGALLQPVRIALTGRKVSPNLFEVMTILGKEEVVKRVMAYINA